jgi:arsenite methyltransferase
MAPASRHGNYGVDAPYVLIGLAAGTVVWVVSASFAAMAGAAAAWFPIVGAVFMLATVLAYLHTTLRGKLLAWSQILDDLALRGDEKVLDLGCGRGAVLIAAAKRLTTGRAAGADLWRTADQSGNRIAATKRNAMLEGVTDRVDLDNADLTALPYADGTFDLVLSSLAIHNIKAADGRLAAIDEAVRVLRPGGRLAIADISAVNGYRDRLAELGLADIEVRALGWPMWWGGPWLSTHLVTATKPVT